MGAGGGEFDSRIPYQQGSVERGYFMSLEVVDASSTEMRKCFVAQLAERQKKKILHSIISLLNGV